MTDIKETQMPRKYIDIIENQLEVFNSTRRVDLAKTIPSPDNIPLDDNANWLRIPDVICVYVDMQKSTDLSASESANSTARAYQLFVGTAARIFNAFGSPYFDISGDAVFALFNSNQPYRALAAAVTFKTFSMVEFVPKARELTDVKIGTHMGIDQKTVLVKRLGMRDIHEKDRNNEVWAGKPVNMAAKLASLSTDGELFVSSRFYKKIQHRLTTMSCGCLSEGPKPLWKEVDVTDEEKFDFDTAYKMDSYWCPNCGKKYCLDILKLDK